jgi:O-antigen/teichoic acid export membrane protein
MGGTVVSGILSYGSVALNARLLGPDGFGLVGALLGVSSLASVLLRPASYAATHLAIAAHARSDSSALRALLGFSVAVSVALSIILVIVLLVLGAPLNTLLQTSGLLPLALLAPLLAGSASLQLTSGLLSGAHRFAWLAAASIVESAARAVVIAPLAVLWGVSGSLAAYVTGQIAGVAFSVLRAGGLAWQRPPMQDLVDGLRTGLSAVSLVAGVALLQNGDLILLRWYGHPDDAGLYAACTSLGNLFVTLSAPLYVPAFPRALAAHRQGQPTHVILLSGIAPILAAGILATVGSIWLGPLTVGTLLGPAFEAAGRVLPIYLAKTTALVMVGVLGQHAMATGRGSALHVAVPVALGGLTILGVLRPDPGGTASLVLVCAMVLVLWLSGTMLARRHS